MYERKKEAKRGKRIHLVREREREIAEEGRKGGEKGRGEREWRKGGVNEG